MDLAETHSLVVDKDVGMAREEVASNLEEEDMEKDLVEVVATGFKISHTSNDLSVKNLAITLRMSKSYPVPQLQEVWTLCSKLQEQEEGRGGKSHSHP